MPVIMDDENADDEEEDEFMPVSSTTFIKPDMNRDVTWDDVSSVCRITLNIVPALQA